MQYYVCIIKSLTIKNGRYTYDQKKKACLEVQKNKNLWIEGHIDFRAYKLILLPNKIKQTSSHRAKLHIIEKGSTVVVVGWHLSYFFFGKFLCYELGR